MPQEKSTTNNNPFCPVGMLTFTWSEVHELMTRFSQSLWTHPTYLVDWSCLATCLHESHAAVTSIYCLSLSLTFFKEMKGKGLLTPMLFM